MRRAELRRHNRGRRIDYATEIMKEAFDVWLTCTMVDDERRGAIVSEDVKDLMMPPSRKATNYRAMNAYGNHIHVRSAEVDLITCDSGVVATFSQECQAIAGDRNMMTTNLEYIGWMEEIIGVDYINFKLLVLYYTWVKADMRGPHATMKQDEYGFTLIRPDCPIRYSADSFAFPVYVQQVFFVDDMGNLGWKVVLRKEARSVRIASEGLERVPV